MVQIYITIKLGINREIKNILQPEDIAKFIKSAPTKNVWSC
jgi:hypothetical protein